MGKIIWGGGAAPGAEGPLRCDVMWNWKWVGYWGMSKYRLYFIVKDNWGRFYGKGLWELIIFLWEYNWGRFCWNIIGEDFMGRGYGSRLYFYENIIGEDFGGRGYGSRLYFLWEYNWGRFYGKGLWEYYVGRLRRPGGRRPPQMWCVVKLEMSRILGNE
jgi:hypothetical protein